MKVLKPKGTLIPIGGAEDKQNNKDILCRVVAETGRKKPKILLITLATSLPREVFNDYKAAFKSLGHLKLEAIHYTMHSEADSDQHLKMVKNCHVVLFSGGDQLKLSSLMGGTKLFEAIKTRYFDEANFVVAGTSAGAAAMSDTMIISGSSRDAMVKGELELTNGLDLIHNVFIDTHFTQRGRFGRILQTITCNPGVLGIGLGEDTAVVVHKGEELEVIGSGLVIIADGTTISYTDLAERKNGELVTVEGIVTHVLGPGKRFLLASRRIKHTEAKVRN